ncbi:MAG TPA: TetR/AcrR family transcriptional regulator [Vicinamibacteria bacterium]
MADTRRRLLDAGLRLFAEKGFRGTSVGDIEKAAGLVPRAGAFYRHFPSKAALAAEIGETSLIETRRDLGLDGALPLGDTRAELVLIARGYRRAFERQAPLAGLIAEVRALPEIRALEDRVDRDLTEALLGWLATKPYAAGIDRAGRVGLLLAIVGSWTLYLQKRGSAACPPELTDEAMLAQWADLWRRVLDGTGPG